MINFIEDIFCELGQSWNFFKRFYKDFKKKRIWFKINDLFVFAKSSQKSFAENLKIDWIRSKIFTHFPRDISFYEDYLAENYLHILEKRSFKNICVLVYIQKQHLINQIHRCGINGNKGDKVKREGIIFIKIGRDFVLIQLINELKHTNKSTVEISSFFFHFYLKKTFLN